MSQKRKAPELPPPSSESLAAAVEAAKQKAAARSAGIWQESLAGPRPLPETNYGSAEDAAELIVSRGAFTHPSPRAPPASFRL